MKLLLTNDDGIDAPGLQALREAAHAVGQPTIAAPLSERSGAAHRVTTAAPIQLKTRHEQAYAIDGTPADCVRLGLFSLVPDAAWVLSGINSGGNLGADVHHSGTVAAVREAVVHGRPGIAVSHYKRKNSEIDWNRAVRWTIPLLKDLMERPYEAGTFWSINLPDLPPGVAAPEAVFCALDPNPLPLDYVREGDAFYYSGNYHHRRRNPGSDVDVCFGGKIAITLIKLF